MGATYGRLVRAQPQPKDERAPTSKRHAMRQLMGPGPRAERRCAELKASLRSIRRHPGRVKALPSARNDQCDKTALSPSAPGAATTWPLPTGRRAPRTGTAWTPDRGRLTRRRERRLKGASKCWPGKVTEARRCHQASKRRESPAQTEKDGLGPCRWGAGAPVAFWSMRSQRTCEA